MIYPLHDMTMSHKVHEVLSRTVKLIHMFAIYVKASDSIVHALLAFLACYFSGASGVEDFELEAIK